MGKSLFRLLFAEYGEEILAGAFPSVVAPEPKPGVAFDGLFEHLIVYLGQLECRQGGSVIGDFDVSAEVFPSFRTTHVAIEDGCMEHL